MQEKLYELIRDCDCGCSGCDGCKYEADEAECISHMAHQMTDHLIANGASLRPKGEWISVEDRLPQEGGAVCENVILFMDNGLVTVGWLNQITNRGYYLDTINDVVIKAPLSRFTHWMPLPEPPDMRGGL